MAQPGKTRPLVQLMAMLVLLYAFTSGAIAVANNDQCSGRSRSWQLVPPEWVCR